MHAPTGHDAAAIVQAVLHEPAQTVRRFPTEGFAAEIDRGHAQRLGGIFDGWMRVLER